MEGLDKLKELSVELLSKQHFDCLAVGLLCFERSTFSSFEIHGSRFIPNGEERFFFDLASLTKPLVLASYYLINPSAFNEQCKLLLNHEGGLPSGGRLSSHNWREQIESYSIQKSPALYSDFSALRLMLEIEKKVGKSLKILCQDILKDKIHFWKDLKLKNLNAQFPVSGERQGRKICGEVHDDNALIIGEFCSHAGLFAKIDDLCQSILDLDKNFGLLRKIKEEFDKNISLGRFILGWDRVLDLENTLAGKGAGNMTFGHLGFTGTSLWIDQERKKGYILLTNATKTYSYDRTGLNHLRRTLGEFIWKMLRS